MGDGRQLVGDRLVHTAALVHYARRRIHEAGAAVAKRSPALLHPLAHQPLDLLRIAPHASSRVSRRGHHPRPVERAPGAPCRETRGRGLKPVTCSNGPQFAVPVCGGLFTQAAHLQFWGVGDFAEHRLGCRAGTAGRRGRADVSAGVCRLAASGRRRTMTGPAPACTSRVSPSLQVPTGRAASVCRRASTRYRLVHGDDRVEVDPGAAGGGVPGSEHHQLDGVGGPSAEGG